MCKNCLVKNITCNTCEYNASIEGTNYPCGQQNCWYSCTVCKANHKVYCADGEEEED